MSDSLTGVLVGLAADTGVALLLYYFYKRSIRAATEIKKAKLYELDKSLLEELKSLPDNAIPYGCVEGITAATRSLKSHYKDDIQGVVRNVALIEHKSKRSNGIWTDVKNVIRDVIDSVPFYLHKPKCDDVRVHITEPKSAEFLLDELTSTYDNYQSNQSGIMQRGLDRIFGEVTKGVHEYETMLVLGTPLLGIGKLRLENGKITLGPTDNKSRFILTEKTKEEVIKHFSSQSNIIKIFLGIATVIGIGLAVVVFKKLYKRWTDKRMYERMMEEVQEARRAARSAARDRQTNGDRDTSDNNSLECVICLSNPREVILLDCGHICTCLDCVESLPRPIKCPVCRRDVSEFRAAYIA